MFMSQENIHLGEGFHGEFRFSYKRLRDHLQGFFNRPLALFLRFVAIFGSLWTLREVVEKLFALDNVAPRYYIGLVAVAAALSLVWQGYEYFNTCPAGLEGVSKRAQRIAHIQRPKWEYRLAKALLAERIGSLEKEYRDVQNGELFMLARRLDKSE